MSMIWYDMISKSFADSAPPCCWQGELQQVDCPGGCGFSVFVPGGTKRCLSQSWRPPLRWNSHLHTLTCDIIGHMCVFTAQNEQPPAVFLCGLCRLHWRIHEFVSRLENPLIHKYCLKKTECLSFLRFCPTHCFFCSFHSLTSVNGKNSLHLGYHFYKNRHSANAKIRLKTTLSRTPNWSPASEFCVHESKPYVTSV